MKKKNPGSYKKHNEHSSGWITGEHYYDSKCDCSTPPWEVCEHSFPEVIEAEIGSLESYYEVRQ